MPNKSISQLPIATTRLPGDKLIISRERALEPGVFDDFQVDESLYPAIEPFSETITIPSAQILTLFTDKVLLVQTPGDGSVILPISADVSLTGVVTPYATNVVVTILGDTASPASQYWSSFQIDSATDFDIALKGSSTSNTRLYADQSLYVQAQTGDPTDGDGDLIITIWYQLLYP